MIDVPGGVPTTRDGVIARVVAAMLVCLGISACVHKLVPVAVLVPILRWNLPLTADDDARFCVETELAAGIDPADVLPLRCVTVGAIRQWIRAQRFADE